MRCLSLQSYQRRWRCAASAVVSLSASKGSTLKGGAHVPPRLSLLAAQASESVVHVAHLLRGR